MFDRIPLLPISRTVVGGRHRRDLDAMVLGEFEPCLRRVAP